MSYTISFTTLELAMLNRIISINCDRDDIDFKLINKIFGKVSDKYLSNEVECEEALRSYLIINPEPD